MDSGQYDEAKQIILEKLKEIETDKKAIFILLAEIASFLIDIGHEHMDGEAAERRIHHGREPNPFEGQLTDTSYY